MRDDITVTAHRRTERAQDVPIALNVVSDKLLSARDGYASLAPVGCFPANGFGLVDMIGNA